MAIVWNNRNDQFDLKPGSVRDSFEEHAERMTMFRKLHTYAQVLKTPGHDRTALLENGQTLLFANTITATGGSRGTIGKADWSALIPMWKVTPRRFSRN